MDLITTLNEISCHKLVIHDSTLHFSVFEKAKLCVNAKDKDIIAREEKDQCTTVTKTFEVARQRLACQASTPSNSSLCDGLNQVWHVDGAAF
jgi:hypothetical protein